MFEYEASVRGEPVRGDRGSGRRQFAPYNGNHQRTESYSTTFSDMERSGLAPPALQISGANDEMSLVTATLPPRSANRYQQQSPDLTIPREQHCSSTGYNAYSSNARQSIFQEFIDNEHLELYNDDKLHKVHSATTKIDRHATKNVPATAECFAFSYVKREGGADESDVGTKRDDSKADKDFRVRKSSVLGFEDTEDYQKLLHSHQANAAEADYEEYGSINGIYSARSSRHTARSRDSLPARQVILDMSNTYSDDPLEDLRKKKARKSKKGKKLTKTDWWGWRFLRKLGFKKPKSLSS